MIRYNNRLDKQTPFTYVSPNTTSLPIDISSYSASTNIKSKYY